jgi:hypothetical protein
MAGVFREVDIEWDGETYTFTPSMRLIRSIERGDGDGPVCIMQLIHAAQSGSPQFGFMAWLVAKVMTFGGAKVDEMMDAKKEALSLYINCIDAISPAPKVEKGKKPKPPVE